MAAAKKATVVTKATTTKPKAPPAKKFGEVGYRFPVMMEIVEANGDEDEEVYAFVIAMNLNEWEDYNSSGHKIGFTFSYPTKQSLITDISKHDKKVAKQLKAEEIKVAEAVVAKLKKELESL